MAMERDYLQFDLQKPPLPFVGNKLRWWRTLRPLIEALPRGALCFDAFTGCFAVAKLLQRFGHGLRIVANDCGRYYRSRLDAVKDTNRVISEMLAAGAHNGMRRHYERYSPEIEQKLIQICATGRDQISCRINLYCGKTTIRARCRLVPYDEDACAHWIDGLEVCDLCLDASMAASYAGFDLVVLDPPYRRTPASWGQGEYIGRAQCMAARAFCAEMMRAARGSVWLFDEPDSDLVAQAREIGAVVHEYTGKRNRQEAHEVMCEIRRIPNAYEDLPLFAYASKNGLPI